MKNIALTILLVLLISGFISAQGFLQKRDTTQKLIDVHFNEDVAGWTIGVYDTLVNDDESRDNLEFNNINLKQYLNTIDFSLNGNKSITEITFSEEYIFNSDSTYAPDIACFDETHFVLAYPDTTQNRCGIVMAGTIYPDSIVFGDKIIFHTSSVHNYIRLKALSSTRFVVAYIAGWPIKGYAMIGDVASNNISLGPTFIFNPDHTSSFISVSSLSSERIVISFSENDNSVINLSAVIGNITNNSINFSDEYPINPGGAYSNIVLGINSTRFVDIYSDQDQGKAIIGTYSGGSISYGNVFEFNNPGDANYMDASYLGNNRIAIVYTTDYGKDYSQNAVIATIIGDSIIFGEDYIFSPPTSPHSPAYRIQYSEALDTSNFVISFLDHQNSKYCSCILGTVYGDSIDYSPTFVYNPNTPYFITRMSKINSSHFLIAYPYARDEHGSIKIGTISIETSIMETRACADSVHIPVFIKHLDGIVEFSLKLDYDTSKLIYDGFLNSYSQLNNGTLNIVADSGEVSIDWASNETLTIIADTLLILKFAPVNPLILNVDSLTWNTSSSYYLDSCSFDVTSIFNNGTYYIDPVVDTAGLILGADSVYSGSIGEVYTTTSIVNANSYYWFLEPDSAGYIYGNDTSISIDFSQNYFGTATLSVAGTNQCGEGIPGTKIIYIIADPTEINTINQISPEINIWPNPSYGEFTVSISGTEDNIKVSLYNFSGQLVQSEEIYTLNKRIKLSYDFKLQLPGIYLIRITGKDHNFVRKLVFF